MNGPGTRPDEMQTLTFELQMHVQSADGVAARAAGARVPAVTRTPVRTRVDTCRGEGARTERGTGG